MSSTGESRSEAPLTGSNAAISLRAFTVDPRDRKPAHDEPPAPADEPSRLERILGAVVPLTLIGAFLAGAFLVTHPRTTRRETFESAVAKPGVPEVSPLPSSSAKRPNSL